MTVLRKNCHHRRGAVLVFAAMLLLVLLGFAALAIDGGRLLLTRTELQAAADAAALAGVSGCSTDTNLQQDHVALREACFERASDFARRNRALNAIVQLAGGDLVLGAHDHDNPGADLDTSGAARFNAVELTVRRTAESANGPVAYVFATIFGYESGNVVAVARAVFDDRFAGFRVEEGDYPNMIPVTINKSLYDEMITSGSDGYSWSEDDGVSRAADGVREVRLYPWRVKNGGGRNADPVYETEGSGNFGLLDFQANGSSDLESQVLNGLSPAEVEGAIGSDEFVYVAEDGSPSSYPLNGESGMHSSIADAFESRIGDVVGFFLHDDAERAGTNTTFNNVGIRFGRIVEVAMTGSPSRRQVVIQPVAYAGASVVVRDYAPSSLGQLGRLRLTR